MSVCTYIIIYTCIIIIYNIFQVVRVKEDAIQGLRIHTVQAFDPDGDSLIFTFGGSASLFLRNYECSRLTTCTTVTSLVYKLLQL